MLVRKKMQRFFHLKVTLISKAGEGKDINTADVHPISVTVVSSPPLAFGAGSVGPAVTAVRLCIMCSGPAPVAIERPKFTWLADY